MLSRGPSRLRRHTCLVASACALVATGSLSAPVAAQAQAASSPNAPALEAEALHAALVRGFEQHRAMDLAFVAAIPDSALRWAPTSGVRDFAQQMEHIAGSHAYLLQGVFGTSPPSPGDSATYLNDKEALADMVASSYDWVLTELRGFAPQRLTEDTELIGRRMSKWNALLFALQHADWTRGQLVPYFRLNGVDPPQWRPY